MRVLPDVVSFGPASPEEILRPPQPWFVFLTLFLAFIAHMVPLSGVALALRPDFLALVLLYWCIQAPRLVGVGSAWIVGLLMDVADATLFGQHALAYAVLAYSAEYFRRRVLRFPLWQQAAQVALLLLLCAGIYAYLENTTYMSAIWWAYMAPPLLGAFLWPLVSVVLQWPQRPPPSPADL